MSSRGFTGKDAPPPPFPFPLSCWAAACLHSHGASQRRPGLLPPSHVPQRRSLHEADIYRFYLSGTLDLRCFCVYM